MAHLRLKRCLGVSSTDDGPECKMIPQKEGACMGVTQLSPLSALR